MNAPQRLAFVLSFSAPLPLLAQNELQVHGNFNADGYLYREDSTIQAYPPPEDFGLNAWTNLIFTYGPVEAGLRFESYEPALLGYPAGQPYEGSGLGYRYATYRQDDLEVTAGNFFEQFGSGLVFRSYEERYLGVDNAMDGARIKYRPVKGLYLKGIVGKQRFGFDDEGYTTGPGIVRGFDGELQLVELCDSMAARGQNLIIGGSFVSKYQEDKDPLRNLPENVGSWAGRLNYTNAHWNLYTEYAHKINDPNSSNGFIYKDGEALMLNATYSTKGIGISAGAHTYDNMVYRSDRAAPTPFDLNINFLPTLAKQHTYNLAATLYPYATQPNGEVGWQGEVFYKWKKGTRIGGSHGTKLTVNYSTAYALDSVRITGSDSLDGYTTNFFKPDMTRQYYYDVNVEVRKRVSDTWELALTWFNEAFDIEVVQGKAGKSVIYYDLFVLEGLHGFTDVNSIRFELQHLSTRQDLGGWFTAVAELTFSPHWSITAMDQFNYDSVDQYEQNADETWLPGHFPLAAVAYSRGANRFQVNYGRQRAGIFCVGGVCRQVPAASGLSFSIASTF